MPEIVRPLSLLRRRLSSAMDVMDAGTTSRFARQRIHNSKALAREVGKQKAPAEKEGGKQREAATKEKEKERDTAAAVGKEKEKAKAAEADVYMRSTSWERGVATRTGMMSPGRRHMGRHLSSVALHCDTRRKADCHQRSL